MGDEIIEIPTAITTPAVIERSKSKKWIFISIGIILLFLIVGLIVGGSTFIVNTMSTCNHYGLFNVLNSTGNLEKDFEHFIQDNLILIENCGLDSYSEIKTKRIFRKNGAKEFNLTISCGDLTFRWQIFTIGGDLYLLGSNDNICITDTLKINPTNPTNNISGLHFPSYMSPYWYEYYIIEENSGDLDLCLTFLEEDTCHFIQQDNLLAENLKENFTEEIKEAALDWCDRIKDTRRRGECYISVVVRAALLEWEKDYISLICNRYGATLDPNESDTRALNHCYSQTEINKSNMIPLTEFLNNT